MTRDPATAAAAVVPRTVGIWLELGPDELAAVSGDPRIRHARGIVLGLDVLPEVEMIVVPCLPAARALVEEAFADSARPGRLISDKLRVITAGRDRKRRAAIRCWAEGRLARCRERLARPPAAWTGRPLRLLNGLLRRLRLSLQGWMLGATLAVLRSLPPPHASVVAELRRRGPSGPWLVPWWAGRCGLRLPGRKLLDLGGHGPADERAGECADAGTLLRFAVVAEALAVPSWHAAEHVTRILDASNARCRVVVIPPAPLPVGGDRLEAAASRRLLARELRQAFSGGDGRPLHRHFCDFPFERVEYLLVTPPPAEAEPVLAAYATVLRRQRRDLKLVIDGHLPPPDRSPALIHDLGLVFDVAEAAGLRGEARSRLLRHARAVVVPTEAAGSLPPAFAEAVAAGSPVVMGRLAAAREFLTTAELARPEYFEIGAGGGLERAILHVLDHREEVLARQRAILARLRQREWAVVAAEYLGLLTHAG